MGFLDKIFGRSPAGKSAADDAPLPKVPATAVDRAADPWFWSHYEGAANIVLSLVPRECLGKGRRVVDFGCGDGATSLGVASSIEADVVGVDLYKTYLQLPDLTQKNLGTRALPRSLSFVQTELGQPMPFADGSVDLIYSWSVFEHVADVKGVLAELGRIAKPGARLFIQVEPLYYGPYGSHLQRLVDEPWAHLRYGEEEFLRMSSVASDHVAAIDQDTLYRTNSFDDVKRYLLSEYKSLNKIKAENLVDLVSQSGFAMEMTRLIKAEGLMPDKHLLEKYPLELLMTNQIVLVAKKQGEG